jgi:transcriptional regulator with XRE-family HTH domain
MKTSSKVESRPSKNGRSSVTNVIQEIQSSTSLKTAEREALVAYLSDQANQFRNQVPVPKHRSTSRLGQVLAEVIRRLGSTQKQLADLAQIHESQLSSWLRDISERSERKEFREAGPNEVCRLSWALTALIDGNEWRGPARGNLDVILNSLLSLAGYSSQFSLQDVIWRNKIVDSDKEPKALRIGWFEWPPFIDIGPTGFGKEVAQQVCSFFHRGPVEFIKVPMHWMSEYLREHEIDITAPTMMRFPRRLAWLRYSHEIPGISVGFDAIFQTRRKNMILAPGALEAIRAGERFHGKHLNLDQIEPIVAAGESTELVAKFGFDVDALPIQPEGPTGHAYDLIEEHVLSRKDKERGRILFTNEVTCETARTRLPDELTRLSEIVGNTVLDQMQLPFAFGVHPEERQLLVAINDSIKVLDQLHYFENQIQHFNLTKHKTESTT